MLKIVPVIFASLWLFGLQDWGVDREKAEAQHEIVMLLIKEDRFGEVAKESAKLFALKHPPEQEGLIVGSARVIAKALTDKERYELVLTVMDQAIKALTIEPNQGIVMKEKAYAYKKLGRDDEAMEAFVESTRLLESTKKKNE